MAFGQERNPSHTNNSLEDEKKSGGSSHKRAYILSIISKCKFYGGVYRKAKKRLEECLLRLDGIPETSLPLRALLFSDYVTIAFDLRCSDTRRMRDPEMRGWYSEQTKELCIGAKGLLSDDELVRNEFGGTFAHELSHWCIGLVFKNDSRPYYISPQGVDEREYIEIVQEFQNYMSDMKERSNDKRKTHIHEQIDAVDRDYEEPKHEEELIVRVPQLIASVGLDKAKDILFAHEPTKKLFHFYQTYVMNEIKKFTAEGELEGSRKTIYRSNQESGLLRRYQTDNLQFENGQDITLQKNASHVVCSSSHPYLSFLWTAWTLNCKEPTNRFYGNNLFIDCDASQGKTHGEALGLFRDTVESTTLFVICETPDTYKIFDFLLDQEELTKQYPGKMVRIFIPDSLTELTKKRLAETPAVRYENGQELGIQDLKRSSKRKLLESSITLLSKKIKLGDFLEEDNEDLIDGYFIERLLKNENIIIHNRADSVCDRPPGFVSFSSRTELSVQSIIDLINECSTDSSTVSVVIAGEPQHYPEELERELCQVLKVDSVGKSLIRSISELQYLDPCNILLIPPGTELKYSTYNDFFESTKVRYFINITSERTIYSDLMFHTDMVFSRVLHMKKEGEKIMKDSIQTMMVQTVRTEEVNEEKVSEIESKRFIRMLKIGHDKVIVLSDIAGSGKSNLLNLIYHSITDCWVVKIPLKSTSSLIDKYGQRRGTSKMIEWNMERAVKFLSESGKICDKFAVEVFKRKMQNGSKYPIILLFDGLDEITSSEQQNRAAPNKEMIANLLKFLRENTCLRILVTTRPDAESYLCDLQCPIYKFTPLSLTNALEYIKNSCVARARFLPKSDVAKGNIVISFPQGSTLSENPLDVSVLSDAHFERIRSGIPMRQALSNSHFSVENFYAELIKMKYRISFTAKKSTARDSRLEEICDLTFQKLALCSLHGNKEFSRDMLANDKLFLLDSGNQHINLVYEEVEKYFDIGIISPLSSNTISFVHNTFAEYFVSQLFISWAQQKPTKTQLINEVLYNPLGTNSFFEYFLESASFSKKIVKYHGSVMSTFGTQRTLDALDEYVKLGRWKTVEHILRCWRSAEKVKMLVESALVREKKPFSKYIKFVAKIPDGRLPKALDSDYKTLLASKTFIVKARSGQLSKLELENISRSFKVEKQRMSPSSVERSIFLSAFEKGNKEFLKALVQTFGTNVISKEEGRHLIHLAAASGNTVIVKWLKKKGANIFSHTAGGASTVTFAILRGQLKMVKWLIEQKVNVAKCPANNDGCTVVHHAVISDQYPLVQWLVKEKGLDINATDDIGLTPLHVALICSAPKRNVEDLLNLGADVEARSPGGWSALHHASAYHYDLSVLELLMEWGCKVDDTTVDGLTAVDVALQYNVNVSDETSAKLLKNKLWSSNSVNAENQRIIPSPSTNTTPFLMNRKYNSIIPKPLNRWVPIHSEQWTVYTYANSYECDRELIRKNILERNLDKQINYINRELMRKTG